MKKNSLNFFINRRVIISLIVLALILIGHYSGLLKPLEGAVFSAAKPLNKIFYSKSSEISNGSEKSERNLSEELASCQQKTVSLAVDSARANELQDENNKLRADVLAQEFLSEKNEARQNIIIDKGFKDGVSVGLGVINEEGVIIGKVIEAKDRSAKICLITSNSCKLAATLQNQDKTTGVSEGNLGLTIKMNFIPQTEKININDLVITSGLGEIIPRGLLIGRVSEVMDKSNEIWQSAVIEPLVDLNNLTIVAVVLP